MSRAKGTKFLFHSNRFNPFERISFLPNFHNDTLASVLLLFLPAACSIDWGRFIIALSSIYVIRCEQIFFKEYIRADFLFKRQVYE